MSSSILFSEQFPPKDSPRTHSVNVLLKPLSQTPLPAQPVTNEEVLTSPRAVDDFSAKVRIDSNAIPPEYQPASRNSFIKLPPLVIQPSRSLNDLHMLEISGNVDIPLQKSETMAYSPAKTPSLWGDRRKLPSPSASLSHPDTFNTLPHRLGVTGQKTQLRRPLSPVDIIAHQSSKKNLLKASLTPKASTENFFGTVDAETVAIDLFPCAYSTDLEDAHFVLQQPSILELMTKPPIERVLSNTSISDAETISGVYSNSLKESSEDD